MGYTLPNLHCQIALSLCAGACEEVERAQQQQHRRVTPPHPQARSKVRKVADLTFGVFLEQAGTVALRRFPRLPPPHLRHIITLLVSVSRMDVLHYSGIAHAERVPAIAGMRGSRIPSPV